jgi:hypothetical protein
MMLRSHTMDPKVLAREKTLSNNTNNKLRESKLSNDLSRTASSNDMAQKIHLKDEIDRSNAQVNEWIDKNLTQENRNSNTNDNNDSIPLESIKTKAKNSSELDNVSFCSDDTLELVNEGMDYYNGVNEVENRKKKLLSELRYFNNNNSTKNSKKKEKNNKTEGFSF